MAFNVTWTDKLLVLVNLSTLYQLNKTRRYDCHMTSHVHKS